MVKNRWETASGKVIAMRLPDTVYGIAEIKAKEKGVTVGAYLKGVICKGLLRTVNGSENTKDIQPDPEKLVKFQDKYGR